MKKVLTFATAATMLAFIACGPSAEEKQKAEQHVKDSLRTDSTNKAAAMQAAAMKAKSDSAAMKAKSDSAMMKAKADSAAMKPAGKTKK